MLPGPSLKIRNLNDLMCAFDYSCDLSLSSQELNNQSPVNVNDTPNVNVKNGMKLLR